MKATSAQYVGVLSKAALGRMDDLMKRVAVTISVVGCVILAIALAPNVSTALATARATTTTKDATLNQQPNGSCVAFEAWFLDPACRKPHAKNKAARARHHREG